ncbi:SusD/RagB family nutrient-binding outer membrane lipoprotein [Gelidibacter pelagius]|uniref:SusD/RagB family nutrient-binding outer membrane lipoprotein n=1 Tax=Gelidibacter pelagius TaxID=2819985 RepID=A0ABS3SRL5_9FLAO|nr:SusD/RagB family nutrient-binding outer membrane lipoprotein [Gelidibacter pelagius]MBO3098360.1 SusD/RagB family nutrient-binding outer membrane lipoprotein [Gelidibacter pelagius]
MKKILVLMVMLAISFSCQDHLDDLRDNPNAVTSIDDAALFTKAVRSLFQGTTDASVSRFAGHYGHYFVAGSTARLPDQYGDGFDVLYNSMFSEMYGGVIRHIEEVLEITSAEDTKNEVRHSIADVIAVLGYAKLTDAFGEIPYLEGGKGKTQGIIHPKYDPQELIYEDMIARLTSSIAILKNADPSMAYPNSDPIFNNDLNKWVRFANSLRLRLAMRLRDANNTLSRQTVAQCLSEPLMETNDHNASMIETEGNGNAWYTMRTGFPSIKMSTLLIDQLQGTDDPRLSVYVSKDGNGDYNGMTNGLDDTAFGNSNFAARSDMGLALSSKESKLYVMTASEIWLLRAEAALAYDNDPAQANILYRNGIETSLNQWEVDASDRDDFMNSPAASLAGVNDELQIGTQMWVALVPNYFEGWSHIRRTGYPIIADRTEANLAQGATNGVLPKRFLYSSFELSSNNDNVLEAISRQGANKIDTPVWWDKN